VSIRPDRYLAHMGKFTYRIIRREIMAKGWSSLTRLEVEAKDADGEIKILPREVADHGDGAAVLPFDKTRATVLLVRQWRAGPAFGGHEPWLIEACAGLLDADHPEECVRREALEELGTKVRNIRHVCDCHSSPGAVSERISLFVADYVAADRIHPGGGLDAEHEDIEVIEMALAEALHQIKSGGIVDAKTIILLQHLHLEK
jgi:GDP-mannose pyrophosphatase NudK